MLGKSHSPTPDRGTTGGGAGGGAGVAGPDDVDMRIVEDIASWLRVLRLHVSGVNDKVEALADEQKYTTTFEKISWKDMVQMNEDDLIAKGVSAQGARTKVGYGWLVVRSQADNSVPQGVL